MNSGFGAVPHRTDGRERESVGGEQQFFKFIFVHSVKMVESGGWKDIQLYRMTASEELGETVPNEIEVVHHGVQ